MVGGDEVFDDARQVVFLSQFQSFADMRDYNLGGLAAVHLLQGVHASLILGEECGVIHLSDVMIECTRTHQLGFGANLVGYLCGQVSHGDAVLESSGCHFRELAKQVFRCVRQFNQRHVGSESEGFLHDEHQRIGEEQQHAVHDEVFVHVVIHLPDAVILHQLQGQVGDAAADGDDDSRLEQLRTVVEFPQGIDGHQSGHQLDDDEFILVFHGCGAEQDHHYVRDEGCARIHEHTREDGRHGKGQCIDAEDVMLHHQRHQDGEDRDERIEHRDGARLLEIVLAEQGQIDGEQRHQDGDEDSLSGYRAADGAR